MKLVTRIALGTVALGVLGSANAAHAQTDMSQDQDPTSDQTAPPPAAEPPAPAATTPPPAAEPPAPAAAPPPAEPPPNSGYGSSNPAYVEPPLPPPPERDESPGKIPDFSVRVDPFNWLLAGRLGLELEIEAWKLISVELIPVFVTSSSPPLFNYASRDDNLSQHSDGIGPISGASLDVGFWFAGKPFNGTVIRGFITNYAYTYRTRSAGVPIDQVGHTERHLGATIGSYNRYGAFILGGEIGLSTELNNEHRCIDGNADCGELQLRSSTLNSYYNLDGPFHPIYLEGRFSLGVVL